MKKRNHLIRLTVLLIIGIYLVDQFYQLKYSKLLWYEFLLGIVMILGLIFWFYTSIKDLKIYKATRNIRFLIAPIIGIIFIGLIFELNWSINTEFNKPSLLRVYYDGDFNGASFDFKTDGTYIFTDFSIGFSDYEYGTYIINKQIVSLDKNGEDNLIKSRLFEIKDIKENGNDYSAGIYLIQIEANGNEIENATKFRVVADNRKYLLFFLSIRSFK